LFNTQADDVETCLNATILELDIRYKNINNRSFYTDYEMQSNVAKYRERISELENKLKSLENKYSKDIVGVEKRRRGRPKKGELTSIQSNGVKEYLEEKNETPSEYKGMFSELDIQKEMIRVSPNLDIKYIIKGNSKRYREERKKAYKRLYNKNYNLKRK